MLRIQLCTTLSFEKHEEVIAAKASNKPNLKKEVATVVQSADIHCF